jgi:hypothetical protein
VKIDVVVREENGLQRFEVLGLVLLQPQDLWRV